MFSFLARTLAGLEWILAAEIEETTEGKIVAMGHREVRFVTSSLPPAAVLTRPRVADDIFVLVGDSSGIGRTRNGLETISRVSGKLPWIDAVRILKRLRPKASWDTFTAAASFLGKRNYNRFELEDRVAAAVGEATGLAYRPSAESKPRGMELAVRVHLVDDRASFALRVFDSPLHRRSWKQRSCAGTTHPPLASAMGLLAGLRPQCSVLDPFAGVGTIAIEAKLCQASANVIGVDIDPVRVSGARFNAESASAPAHFAVADAGQLPFLPGQMDRIVTNVPWSTAVAPGGSLAGAAQNKRYGELTRSLSGKGRAVILVEDQDTAARRALEESGLRLRHGFQVSVFGRHPWLLVLTGGENDDAGTCDRNAPFGRALGRYIRHSANSAA